MQPDEPGQEARTHSLEVETPDGSVKVEAKVDALGVVTVNVYDPDGLAEVVVRDTDRIREAVIERG